MKNYLVGLLLLLMAGIGAAQSLSQDPSGAAPFPVFRVIAPNGGEDWQMGSSQTISWSGSGGSTLGDSLWYRTGDAEPWRLIAVTGPSTYSYVWSPIPNAPSPTCRVRVKVLLGDSTIEDISDTFFTISAPSFRVISPNGGEVWRVGTDQAISWSGTGGAMQGDSVWYRVEDGAPWRFIASVGPGQYECPWAPIPNTPSWTCKVRVKALFGDTALEDLSDNHFTIAYDDVGPTAILAPAGSLDSGTTVTPRVVLRNFGNMDQGFPVTFRIGSVYAETRNCSLAGYEIDTVAFPAWVAQPVGRYRVSCFTALDIDMSRRNDTAVGAESLAVLPAPQIDVGATAIVEPVGTIDSGTSVTPGVAVRNFGNRSATFPVTFRIGTAYAQTVNRTLGVGETATVRFPRWTARTGVYNTLAFTNLTGDIRRANDTARGTVTVIDPPRPDAGATMILAPTGTVDSGTAVTPQAVVRNFGNRRAGLPVTFRIGTAYAQTLACSLDVGQTDTLSFSVWTAQVGAWNTVVFTNLASDRNRANDTARGAVTVPDPGRYDVGALAVLAPAGLLDSGALVTPAAVVRNLGTREVTFPVTFRIGGVYSQAAVRTLVPGAVDTVTFPQWRAFPGRYATLCYTNLGNDADRANDTARGTDSVRVRPADRHDAEAVAILAPAGAFDSGAVVTPVAVVRNSGTVEATFPVTFRIGGVYSQAAVRTLIPGAVDTVGFPPWTTVPGRYATLCYTNLANDADRANDTARGTDSVNVRQPPPRDVGATLLLSPVGLLDSGTAVVPRAVVRNFGGRDADFPVTFIIGGAYRQSVDISLAPDRIDTVAFPAWSAQVGVYAVRAFTDLADDADRRNDTARGADSIRVLPPPRPDVGAVAILAPADTLEPNVLVTPTAIIRNFGNRDAFFPITFRIGTIYDQTIQVTLPAGRTDTVGFTAWTADRGSFPVVCFTHLGFDLNRGNDTVRDNIQVGAGVEPAADIAAEAVLAPTGETELGVGRLQTLVSPRARIANPGALTASGFLVRLRIDRVEDSLVTTAYDQTTVITTPLTPGATQEVAFPELYLAHGRYLVTCSTMLAHDRSPANDKAVGDYAVTSVIAAAADGKLGSFIYTRAGECVRRIDLSLRAGDPLQVQWDGLNDRLRPCAPGIYIHVMRFTPVTGTAEQQTTKFLVRRKVSNYLLTWRR